jgi:pre-mRNA-splicing factor SYF1
MERVCDKSSSCTRQHPALMRWKNRRKRKSGLNANDDRKSKACVEPRVSLRNGSCEKCTDFVFTRSLQIRVIVTLQLECPFLPALPLIPFEYNGAAMTVTYADLTALLPLTVPVPTAASHPELLRPEHLSTEHDLLRNPTSLARWNAYLRTVHEEVDQALLAARGKASGVERILLGDSLATPEGRQGLQRLVDVYERALQHHPRSFSLWKDYLATRSRFVLGKAAKPLKLAAPRKRRGQDGVGRTMQEWLEAGKGEVDEIEDGERDYELEWEGALDGVLGYEEWKSLAAAYERAIAWLPQVCRPTALTTICTCETNAGSSPQMPRLWLSYLSLFIHPSCPAALSHTHARRTFDRALRTLVPSLHERIWHLYLTWASPTSPADLAPETIVSVWRRYLARDPSPTTHYIHSVLLALDEPRPLEAAKRLLELSHKVQTGEFKHATGTAGEVKSAYQLLVEWLEVCEKYPEEIGLDAEESQRNRNEREKVEAATDAAEDAGKKAQAAAAAATNNKEVVSPALPAAVTDATSSEHLDVDSLVRTHGLAVYPDQAGRLWTGLATYWIKRGEFALARETFEEALRTVVTLRDFTQVFDAYAEFEESYISGLMETLAATGGDEEEEDEEDRKEDERELDERMKNFEELMDRRPFLVNEVLLRRNPNDVQEWEKRVALYGTDDEKVRRFHPMWTRPLSKDNY